MTKPYASQGAAAPVLPVGLHLPLLLAFLTGRGDPSASRGSQPADRRAH